MNEEKKLNEPNPYYEQILDIVQDELQLHDNNINGDAAHIRDTFLKAEQDYFIHLVTTDKQITSMIQEYNLYDVENLQHLIEKITMDMELGLIAEKDEERYEKILIVLTAAIRDKQKRLVLEKIYSHSHGRTR